jgi:hypothetical protein
MQWPEPPYPPAFQPPGTVFLIAFGLLALCYVEIILYLVFTGRSQVEAERDPNSSPEELESLGAAEENESLKI